MTRRPKAAIRQNRWGNWYGYLGGKRVATFALDTAALVASDTVMLGGSAGAPEAAVRWLAAQQNAHVALPLTAKPGKLP